MFKLNLLKIKKFFLIIPTMCSFAYYTKSFAELDKSPSESSINIVSPEVAYPGDKIDIKVLDNVKENKIIESASIELNLSGKICTDIKQNLLLDAPNFDVKCKGKKQAVFTLKNDKRLSLSPGDNCLLQFKVNVNKTVPKNSLSSISVKVSTNDSNEKKEISKNMLINPKDKVSNIMIDGKNIAFNTNTKEYEIPVSQDKETVDISVIHTDENNKVSDKKTMTKKLNKAKPKTIKVEDYNLTFVKDQNERSKKKKLKNKNEGKKEKKQRNKENMNIDGDALDKISSEGDNNSNIEEVHDSGDYRENENKISTKKIVIISTISFLVLAMSILCLLKNKKKTRDISDVEEKQNI